MFRYTTILSLHRADIAAAVCTSYAGAYSITPLPLCHLVGIHGDIRFLMFLLFSTHNSIAPYHPTLAYGLTMIYHRGIVEPCE